MTFPVGPNKVTFVTFSRVRGPRRLAGEPPSSPASLFWVCFPTVARRGRRGRGSHGTSASPDAPPPWPGPVRLRVPGVRRGPRSPPWGPEPSSSAPPPAGRAASWGSPDPPRLSEDVICSEARLDVLCRPRRGSRPPGGRGGLSGVWRLLLSGSWVGRGPWLRGHDPRRRRRSRCKGPRPGRRAVARTGRRPRARRAEAGGAWCAACVLGLPPAPAEALEGFRAGPPCVLGAAVAAGGRGPWGLAGRPGWGGGSSLLSLREGGRVTSWAEGRRGKWPAEGPRGGRATLPPAPPRVASSPHCSSGWLTAAPGPRGEPGHSSWHCPSGGPRRVPPSRWPRRPRRGPFSPLPAGPRRVSLKGASSGTPLTSPGTVSPLRGCV